MSRQNNSDLLPYREVDRALAANVLRIEESLRDDDGAELIELPANDWRELVAAAKPPPPRRMKVMPANSSGWFWHSLARETGALGHLYSPGAQRGPWPWFPYALDNGAFACWRRKRKAPAEAPKPIIKGDLFPKVQPVFGDVGEFGEFDDKKWVTVERAWHRLIVWAQSAPLKPMWAIVPDVPGNAARTFERWEQYVGQLGGIPPALAVQDGMTVGAVRKLKVQPVVIAVGGTTEWKWKTVAKWARAFPRVHLLRCNSPEKLYELEALGVESCDGTGWSRGDRKQTSGLEEWCRSRAVPVTAPLWPHVCREPRKTERGPLGERQEAFA